jgi:hypothetical protein
LRALLVAVLVSLSSAALAPAATGGWGHALPEDDLAQVNSVSCRSPGDCSAGGYSAFAQGHQAMVVSEVHGRWRTAINVPGSAALNAGEDAAVNSVSCASPGNCGAGGFYADDTTAGQAFVASQVNGSWHKAVVFPGITALNTGGIAAVTSVSCASAGDCSAAGYYTDNQAQPHLFVVSEVRGAWGKPIAIPGITALSHGLFAGVSSVSCASAGNCAAGGWFTDRQGNRQAFLVSEVNNTWRAAFEVPGTAALNSAGLAEVTSVSCPSAGNCAAGGYYEITVDGDAHGPLEAFVVSKVKGTWRNAIEVPGTAALNHGDAQTTSVSCPSSGNCAAGGSYIDDSRHGIEQGFVASEVNGTWRKAIEVPATGAVNIGPFAGVTSVSCASPGNCAAGGFYTGRGHHQQAFVLSQVNGTWQDAVEVPGIAALNAGGQAQVTTVSCVTARDCAAAGFYTASFSAEDGFVVSRTS